MSETSEHNDNADHSTKVDGVDLDRLAADLCSDDDRARSDARQILANVGRPAVPVLVELLSQENNHGRWGAAETLRMIGDPRAAPALVKALEDYSGSVRWAAAKGLIALGRNCLIPLLEALMHRSDSVRLRAGAHHVFHAFLPSWPEIAGPLLAALDSPDPDLEVSIAAQKALHDLPLSDSES